MESPTKGPLVRRNSVSRSLRLRSETLTGDSDLKSRLVTEQQKALRTRRPRRATDGRDRRIPGRRILRYRDPGMHAMIVLGYFSAGGRGHAG
eukprot:1682418-Rhodomonas_salina.1